MRRAKLVLALGAVMVAMLVAFSAPAMADDFNGDDFCDFFDCFSNNDFCDFFDCFNNFDGNGFGDFEQEADSGDIDQTFDISQAGDNSNQTVGTTGNANTGNAQNQIGLIQFDSDADDFEFDGGGADIDVSGSSDVSSTQTINQSSAAGKRH